MYICIEVMYGHCFWRREKADTLLRLRGARSRFEGPIGSFSIYACGLGDEWALFYIYTVRNLHVCDCILVLRMVLLF